MDQLAAEALGRLRDIKSVTFASLDQGLPAARIIDVMHVDQEGLLFLTGRGKGFHRQLRRDPWVAISGMGPDYVAVRLVGPVEPVADPAALDLIFRLNPIMGRLYPGDSRRILEVFRIARGKGELFDLSGDQPRRRRFAFGGEPVEPPGYVITGRCTACGVCAAVCPVGAAGEVDGVYAIDGAACLECGLCREDCPEEAIDPPPGL